MTPAQIIWTVLIAAQAVVNVPFILALITKGSPMAVYAELDVILAEIQASIDALPGKLADPAAAQDKADSIAAVQAKADELKAAMGA